ncbi:MAG: hypothetical protein ACLUHE_09035 [Christensenellales bacterium]
MPESVNIHGGTRRWLHGTTKMKCLNWMKEKLYTPVVGDILDQMGYKHQFLPAPVRPLAAQVPTEPYKLRGEQQDNRLKVAGYACTVLEK